MDPEDKLARAAAKHRARAKPVPDDPPPIKSVLDDSLSDAVGVMRVVEPVIGGIALFGPIVALAVAGVDVNATLTLFGAGAVGVVCMIGFMLVRARLAAALARRAIRSFGFGLDVEGYLEQLATARNDGRVVVSIRFTRALDRPTRELVADAARGLLPDLERTTWDDTEQVLELASVELDSSESVVSSTGAARWYTNRLAHHWCLRLMRRVAPRLHAVHPIVLIEIRLRGTPVRA